MSSTEDKLERFYAERLAPAAAHLRARGVSFYSLAADGSEDWYHPPPDVPALVSLDSATFAELLAEHWSREGYDELVALAEPLSRLADELELESEQGDDVSPFTYVMF